MTQAYTQELDDVAAWFENCSCGPMNAHDVARLIRTWEPFVGAPPVKPRADTTLLAAELAIDKAFSALDKNYITGRETAHTVLKLYRDQKAAIAQAEAAK